MMKSDEVTDCFYSDQNDIDYQKLINDEVIQNILNPAKLKVDECNESGNYDPRVSHTELKTMMSKNINWFEVQEKTNAT